MAGEAFKHGFVSGWRILGRAAVSVVVVAAFGLGFASSAMAVPPEVIFDSGPAGPTTETQPTFTFHSDPPASRWECSTDGGGNFSACNIGGTGFTYPVPLPDGPHRFIARAFDNADNVIADGARDYTVDTTGPTVTIDSGPPERTNETLPVFGFTPSEQVATLECRLEPVQPTFTDCSSGSFTPGAPLSDGLYTFEVRGTDTLANAGATTARTFTVDTIPPFVEITGPSDGTSTATPTFEFSANEEASFECRVDGDPFVDCSNGSFTTAPLPDGPHQFQVRATDHAGNPPTITIRFFTVAVPNTSPAAASGSGSAPSATPARFVGSFVLISGKTAKLTRSRRIGVRLNCAGNRNCAGTVLLSSAKRVRTTKRKRARRRIVQLGSKSFAIPAGKTAVVTITISRRNARIVRGLRRLQAKVTVKDKDGAGRARTSTRTITLRGR